MGILILLFDFSFYIFRLLLLCHKTMHLQTYLYAFRQETNTTFFKNIWLKKIHERNIHDDM